jgi:hypothetical protein
LESRATRASAARSSASSSFQDSLDAIRAIAGADCEAAIVPEDRRWRLARYEAKSRHYAVAATHERDAG